MIGEGNIANSTKDKRRVLLVEDNRVSRLVAERLLCRWGYSVRTAADGLEALKYAALDEYDLILMNLQMPRLDGWSTARLIRRLNAHYAQIPIISLSAASQQLMLDNGPFTDFLEKPYMPEQLQNILEQQLSAQATPGLRTQLRDRLLQLSGADRLFRRQLVDLFVKNCQELLHDLDSGRLDQPDFLDQVAHKHKSSLRLLALYPLEAALENLKEALSTTVADQGLLKQRKDTIEQLTQQVLNELAAAEPV